MSNNTKEIGKRMRDRRKFLRLRLEDVGKRVGVSYAQISRFELGKNETSRPVYESIAKALDVSYHWLMTGENLSDEPRIEIEPKPRVIPALLKRLTELPEAKQRWVLQLLDNLRPNLAALFSAFRMVLRGQLENPELDIIRAIAVR